MHIHSMHNWQHDHDFAVIHKHGERRTIQVLGLTADQYEFTSLEGASYANVVPEPGTAALMALGLVGIATVGRRRANEGFGNIDSRA